MNNDKQYGDDLNKRGGVQGETSVGLVENKSGSLPTVMPRGTVKLTPTQTEICHDERPHPDISLHTNAFFIRYKYELDKALLEKAIAKVIQENDSLRLRIAKPDREDRSYQYVLDSKKISLKKLDFTGTYSKASLLRWVQWIKKVDSKPIPLFDSDLFCFVYIKLNEQESGYYVKLHHIISDIWSCYLVFKEIDRVYDHLKKGKDIDKIESQAISYLEYIEGEHRYFMCENFQANKEFWHNIMLPLPDTIELHMIGTASSSNREANNVLVSPIPGSLLTRINEYCKTIGIDLQKFILFTFFIYVYRVTAAEDIIIAIFDRNPVVKKNSPGLIGMCANIIPFRVKMNGDMTFHHFSVKKGKCLDYMMENHARYPFDSLAAELPEETGTKLGNLPALVVSTPVLIDKGSYITEHISDGKPGDSPGIHIHIHYSHSLQDGPVELEYVYDANLFRETDIQRIHQCLVNLQADILDHPGKKISEIELLSQTEREQILYEFNDTAVDHPKDKTIHQLFEEQMEKTPGNIALVGRTLSDDSKSGKKYIPYKELNAKANQLAWLLRTKGLKTGHISAIMVEQSIEMIIGMLAILKAGGAFLPIDHKNPKERVQYMLEESVTGLFLTRSELVEGINFKGEIIELDEPGIYSGDVSGPGLVVKPDHLAYVIFTSGSTGKPKGVLCEHRTLINLCYWNNRYFSITPNDRATKYASLGFDASVWEIFPHLIVGSSLYIVAEEIKLDIMKLHQFFDENRITVSFLPTQLAEQFMNIESNSLRVLLTGGDKLKTFTKRNFQLYNNYGPTENTVVTTSCPVNKLSTNIPIGKPVDNNQILILDKNDYLQPIGVPGELCIGGGSMARGYLNNPELTYDKFFRHSYPIPSSSMQPTRLYRTGDLARRLPDGNIEFVGRIDSQVKVRGFRIELGEIENQLLGIEKIKEAVVLAQNDKGGDKYLCAYFVSYEPIDISSLRDILSRNIPDYMVPSYFLKIDKIPLTANGKVDRKALPDPSLMARKENYAAPRDEIEEKLVELWGELLQVNKENMGIDDNFFNLGGHSLKAAFMMTKVHMLFNVKVLMHHIFDMPTIRKLAEYIKKAKREIYTTIPSAEKKEYYPQTSTQKRMYFFDRLKKNSILYNVQMMDVYCKGIDRESLEKAIRSMIKRHESLRSSFFTINDEAVMRVYDFTEVGVNFEIEYWETADDGMIYSDQKGKEWTRITGLPFSDVVEQFVRPFDLSKAPLLRVGLIKIWKKTQILMVDMHHIMADGVSAVVFMKDLWALYDCEELPGLKVQYKDFTQWLNSEAQKKEVKKQESFWLKEFSGDIPVLNLPYDYPRPAKLTFDGDAIYFELDVEETIKLNLLARQQGVTLYMVLFAVYNILLSKLSGQEEIIIGAASAGRGHADLQNIIGMFVNTLVVRNFVYREKPFKEFLLGVKEKVLAAFENQDYPFEELASKISSRLDVGRNPVFDVIFTMDTEAEKSEEYLHDVLILDRANPFNIKQAKMDMILFGAEKGDELHFNLEYNVNLFEEETIERFIMYYKKIIDSILRDMNQKIVHIDILPDLERGILLYAFNDTETEFPGRKTIQEFFEEQAAKTPTNTAVIFYDPDTDSRESISYRELNGKANQLAHLLQSHGVKSENIVGISAQKSLEMIIGILSILKAGGAYLPLNPDYPDVRKQYLMEDSNSRVLLTNFKTPTTYVPVVIDLEDETIYQDKTKEEFSRDYSKDGLAYIMYTSGSTGKPKGVMVDQINVIRLVKNTNYLDFSEEHRILQTGALEFDASTFEIWGCLLNGWTSYLVSKDTILNPGKLKNTLLENKITTIWMTSALFNQMLDTDIDIFSGLKYLLTGGDVVSPTHVARLKQHVPAIHVINGYGPTENTTFSTTNLIDKDYKDNIPIGKPIANSTAYILDKLLNPIPMGVPGELYVGGDGVSRGYLNWPEMTHHKFLPDPFISYLRVDRRTIYSTGDLARWLLDGTIEFLGRLDFQVKIRGFRIEPGEIENQLRQVDFIEEVSIVPKKDESGFYYLCAYFVSSKKVEIPTLKELLQQDLPAYMIPSYFVQMDALPLTSNGKVDRRALPEPQVEVERRDYTPPISEMEKILTESWSEVLYLEKIGIDDNFFEIGGDSIKTILISAKLMKKGINVSVNDFFSYPTIRKLAENAKKIERVSDQGTVTGKVELTPIQKWFFEKHLSQGHHFNQSVLLYREQGFDEEIIKRVFTKIVEHHDALRMVYGFEKDTVIQKNRGNDSKLFDLEKIQLTKKKKDALADEIKIHANRIQQEIDLKTGPLVKIGLFKGDKGDHLLIVVHHLVVDGVSWRILIEDFETGYQQVSEGKEIVLQDKTDSFQYWAQKLSEYAGSKWILKELDYWKEIEDTAVKTLPVDHNIANEQRKFQYHDIVPLSLSEEKTKQLLTRVNWAYNTEINDVLLTAVGLAVKQWAGLDKVLVNLEGHGREKIIEDVNINRTVGWFTTQYPIILDMKKPEDLSFTIKNVKENLKRIPNKGIDHGILKYLTPDDKKQELQFKQTPEIVFNYLGQFGDESFDLIDHMSEISDPGTGDSIAPGYIDNFKIDIEGATVEGKLNLYFFYHKNEYERKTIEQLAEIVKTSLEQVIDHCAAKKQRELTPSDLGYSKLSIEELERITNEIKVNIAEDMEIKLIYPLSPMQSGMLYHYLKDKESYAYFEQFVLKLRGEVETSILEESLNKIIDRYDTFRTIFVYEGLVEPLQIVLKERKIRLAYEDIAHLSETDQVNYLDQFKKKNREKVFDLTRDHLTRFKLFKTGENSYQLLWTFHHTVMDGWCLGIIREELTSIYRTLKQGLSVRLEPVIPYKHYIDWLVQQDKEEGLSFWNKYLETYEEAAGLPKKTQVVTGNEYKKEEYNFVLDEELNPLLNSLAAQYQVTINTVFQTIWGILLQNYNNKNDVVFGTIVSGRPWEINGIERMVGLFINMVPVRIRSRENQGFFQLLKDIQDHFSESKKFEHLPIAEIQSHTLLKGDLIDHLLVLENYPLSEESDKGFTIAGIEGDEQTNYNFNIAILPWEGYHFVFMYNALVYDRDFIKTISHHLENVLWQVVENPAVDIGEIEIITGAEKNKILFEFNNTEMPYPKDKTVHELFEDQAARDPANIAVVGPGLCSCAGSKDECLTYRELNTKANQLARKLREKGVKPDVPAAIMIEPSQEMIIGMLGILKAGGAFLPIDHKLPKERIKYILEDSGTPFFLTCSRLLMGMTYEGEIIELDQVDLYKGDKENPELVNNSADMAYVIYTSGSTGKPKGVMIIHRTLVNQCSWHIEYYSVTSNDRITKYASFGFDASIIEVYPQLVAGAGICIVPEEIKLDIHRLNRFYEDNGITLAFLPTQMSEQFMAHVNNKSLRVLISAGDKLKMFTKGNYQLYNGYGPTEDTVCTTAFPVNEFSSNIPIGKPIFNNQVYILDKNSCLQPIGIPGELCIGGEGLARGYLNRPILTREKFVDLEGKKWLPHGQVVRIYRTGDLARWLSDGNIEFLGRIDFQVKIRGYRIELGEIEQRLLKLEVIKEAVVIAREDNLGTKYICAYVVSDKPIDVPTITDSISKDLPDYMVPYAFVQLDRFPLNPSGKVDTRALPAPEAVGKEKYEAPTNEIEEILAVIWGEVLGMDKVGIDDNFFQIGGDSIKTILVSARLQKHRLKININDFFSYKTIRELAERVQQVEKIGKEEPTETISITRAEDTLTRKIKKDYETYLQQVKQERWPDLAAQREFRHIFLTGSTGYLGAYLLFELLNNTNAAIYLPVRGKTHGQAQENLKKKMIFYFGENFYQAHKDRIAVVLAEFRDHQLGIASPQYEEMCERVECVVHPAARVKHYGAYEELYKDNVEATERLLEFSLTGNKKDFHFISTMDTGSGDIPGREYLVFTEYCHDMGQQSKNVYVKSKFEAEKKVLAYREKGLNTFIHRAANITFHSETGQFQENIEDNFFYSMLKAYIKIGFWSEKMTRLEYDLSFVNQTARAITALVTRQQLKNETYHICNPHTLNWEDMALLLKEVGIEIPRVNPEESGDYLAKFADDTEYEKMIERVKLYSWIWEEKPATITVPKVDRTVMLLDRIGFQWPKITKQHIEKMIAHCKKVGFL